MKIWSVYIGFLLAGGVCFTYIIHKISNPEQLILGEWKEKRWEYEKVDKPHPHRLSDTISANLKQQLGKHLVIHAAETWCFHPDGTLTLKGKNHEKRILWRMKGRGNILELKYDDKIIEHYNLTELDNGVMILNFDSDIQVRGIAKLTFERS